MRLIIAGHLPPQLKVASDSTTIAYGPIFIGAARFLLPVHATWDTKDFVGAEVRNIIAFENCHEFVGESVLKFDGAEPLAPVK